MGNSLANTLTGNSGSNVLNGGAGADTMTGGVGNDTYTVDNAGDKAIEAKEYGIDQVNSSVSYSLVGQFIERLTLTGRGNINATGNTLLNDLTGNSGNNVLNGGGGGDRMNGGAGDDTLYGEDGWDSMTGGAGNDTLYGGADNDTMTGGAGDDTLDGGAGIDTAEYTSAASGVAVDLGIAGVQSTGGGGNDSLVDVENLDGSSFSDTLTGNEVGNRLSGNGGDDILSGGAGDDDLNGGVGDDTMIGGAGDDTLRGEAGADVLDGGAGADRMEGGGGDDTYTVDNDGDIAIEGYSGGIDQVNSSVSYSLVYQHIEKLTLTGSGNTNATGNGKANILIGNSGNNVLDGGTGDDLLSGGGGSDTLTGGKGYDTFEFDQPLVAGVVTTITDFAPGADRVALSLSIFTQAGAVGPLAADAFFDGTAAHDADDRIIYNASTGALLYDADGSGAEAATTFATLAPGLALSASDFKIV
jgi:serralysin